MWLREDGSRQVMSPFAPPISEAEVDLTAVIRRTRPSPADVGGAPPGRPLVCQHGGGRGAPGSCDGAEDGGAVLR